MFAVLSLTAGACSSGTSASPAGPSADPAVLTAGTDKVVDPDGHILTVRPEGAATVVRRYGRSGQAAGQLSLPGRWILPRVVATGPVEGLAPDGRALVLEGGTTAGASRFALVPSSLSQKPRTITLAGDFTFDAWSPDATILYLVEHRPPRGSGHYVVRAYDIGRTSLRDGAVVDKRNIDEDMAGHPEARAMTPGGAIVATLYLPARGAVELAHEEHGPFVHLLYTDQAQALCVDLPKAVGHNWSLKYARGELLITKPDNRDAFVIDPQTGVLSTA
jgi:hypothetical protein